MPENTLTIAKVLVNLSLDRTFDYRIPEPLLGHIKVGMRVDVPFGKSTREACVIALSATTAQEKLKELLGISEKHPQIPDTLIKLGEWMADYYCCTREQAIRNLLPGAVRSGKIKPKTQTVYCIADPQKTADYLANVTARQKGRAEILRYLMLKSGKDADSIVRDTGTGKSAITALVKEGLLLKELEEVARDPFKNATIQPTKPLPPTPEQKVVLEKAWSMLEHPDDSPHVLLLHGITCSGKTEVYLQTIGRVLEQGGDSIVLVPEISLTPQTVSRFKSRFGEQVSVLHSGLSDGERYDEWMKVHSGKVKIAVGARSALFAPFRNLKLIIVDEEHEQSYKQSEAPRYNARDVAVMRGKLEHALVILGSATPSIESYYNAKTGKYALAEMLRRTDPNIQLPEVRIVDMRIDAKEEGKIPFFSNMLIDGVRQRIARGEQSILFLNKRGYSRKMVCDLCGYIATCPDCGAPYTYHRKSQMLTCHLCGAIVPAPAECPDCQSAAIRYEGAGTERIENLATEFFKGARIARMDSDTMTRPSLYEKVLTRFRRGELDILIGTQMIAKGLDFPNVTLVGIINADMGLSLPDFRTLERTFQLLAQVAGRAGRGYAKGEVLIQTRNPFNPAIQHAAGHDYKSFYEEEIMIREELKYPPFGHAIVLHFDGDDPTLILSAANELTERLKNANPNPDGVTITPPAPAFIERIKGKYRFTSMINGVYPPSFRRLIRQEAMLWRRHNTKVQFSVDVDALNLL